MIIADNVDYTESGGGRASVPIPHDFPDTMPTFADVLKPLLVASYG